MNGKEHIAAAITAAGTAAGFCFATGRAQAVFYAQMQEISWLGIAASAVFYGFLTAMTAYLARKTGADCFPGIYHRLLGCRAGRWIGLLYGFVMATGAVLQLLAAANAGVSLPMFQAGWIACLFALGMAMLVAAAGTAALKWLSGSYLLLLVLFEIALWKWGSVPESRLNFAVNLRLENSYAAAVVFGILHACVSSALSAGVVVRLSCYRMHPLWLGCCCALIMAGANLPGNAALLCWDERLLALKNPFETLAQGWGKPGFYICNVLVFLGATVTLAGIAISLIPCGIWQKNDVKF